MNRVVITAKHLSKKYQLGGSGDLRNTLRSAAQSLFNLRNKSNNDSSFTSLNEVSFEVYEGEVLGIIGRNGAGKSTLLKILSQITIPSSGEAIIKGRVASLLEVGTGFHDELSGRDNIFLNGSILGMRKKEIEEKLDEIIAFSGVEKFIDTPIKKYSSGMKMRLAFSVAAHLEPEILLIDEVLAVGDAAFQEKCLNKMGEVAKGGRTVLFVSHNLKAVQDLCDRCILLEEGRIMQVGVPEKVVSHYLQKVAIKPEVIQKGSHELLKEEKVQVFNPSIESFETDDVALIRIGDRLKLRFKYFVPKALGSIHNVSFLAVVNDVYEQRLFVCDTNLEGSSLLEIDGEGEVTCITEPLNLVGGTYSVDVTLKSAVVVCKVKRIIQFEILENDYYGSGRNLKNHASGIGYLAVRSNWNCQ